MDPNLARQPKPLEREIMAIRDHYLIDSSTETNIVQAALAELLIQQARVLSQKAARGSQYDVKRALDLLNRIAEVHAGGTS